VKKDERTFDPTKYVKEEIKNFLFERRIEGRFVSKEKGGGKGQPRIELYAKPPQLQGRVLPALFKGMDVKEIRRIQ